MLLLKIELPVTDQPGNPARKSDAHQMDIFERTFYYVETPPNLRCVGAPIQEAMPKTCGSAGEGVPSRFQVEISSNDRRWGAGREGCNPMLSVVPGDGSDHEAGTDGSRSLIDEIVREGARRMLAEALQAEVDAYIARFADGRDGNGRRLVARDGHNQPRK